MATQSPFPWYEIVPAEASLEQGDFLDKYPIPIIPTELAKLASASEGARLDSTIPVKRYNLVVVTQSCDIPKLTDEDDLLLCPRENYEDAAADSNLAGESGWSQLVKGHVISLHIISESSLQGHTFPYQVIYLRKVFASPLRVAKTHALNQGPRVRLRPPYREHLGQAFARQFMRVGLPEDLPRENPYLRRLAPSSRP